MRLLKNNTILLAKPGRGEFFAIYDPAEKDPESRDKVVFTDPDSADWLKFVFESKIDEGTTNTKQKRIWTRAATLVGQVCKRLEQKEAERVDG